MLDKTELVVIRVRHDRPFNAMLKEYKKFPLYCNKKGPID
jgi:hypothetical protein